jgi:hypothetical protein
MAKKNGNGDDKKSAISTTNNQQIASTINKAGNEKTLKQNYPSFNIPVAESTGTENRLENLKYDQFHRYPDYEEKKENLSKKYMDTWVEKTDFGQDRFSWGIPKSIILQPGRWHYGANADKLNKIQKDISTHSKSGYVTKSPLNKEKK